MRLLAGSLVHACGEVHGSAGCGKSARPVRRGLWSSNGGRPRLLYRETGFIAFIATGIASAVARGYGGLVTWGIPVTPTSVLPPR
jgi:hypothetical protein